VVISKTIHLPFGSARLPGTLLLLVVAAYFAGSVFRKQPIKIREWEFSLPSVRLSFAQTGIAVFDWALAASVLFTLMPPVSSLSYPVGFHYTLGKITESPWLFADISSENIQHNLFIKLLTC